MKPKRKPELLKSVPDVLADLERVARSGKVETGAALRILWDVGLLQTDLQSTREEERRTAYAAGFAEGFAEGAALAGKRASRSMGFKDGYWESMKGKR